MIKEAQVTLCTLLVMGMVAVAMQVSAQERSAIVVVDQQVSDGLIPAERVRLVGYVADRLNQSYENRVLAQDVEHLIEPFRNRTETRLWQSEFWGKWFTSAVLAYRYRPEPRLREVLDGAVAGLLATQTEDGYIGNYAPGSHLQEWDIWGRKYTMLGLLDYYEVTGDALSLQAAQKVADHLIGEIKGSSDGLIITKGNYRGMAGSSALEPMVKLYRLSGRDEYLDFAKEIVREWELEQGPQLLGKSVVDVSKRFPRPKQWYSPEQGQKAYEMMSCYEGLLELYRVTGLPEYREAVENTWQNIRDTEINIAGSGASEEMWFGGRRLQAMPVTHYQETCVTVTWIKLNLQLLRLTGDVKYADEIEKAYYNALLGALNRDGSDWAKYTPLNGERLPGSGQCGMDLNCCNASGPRGQFILPLTAVMSTNKGVAVSLYVGGEYDLKTPKGQDVTIKQETDYPVSGAVKLSLQLDKPEEFALRLRIPAWSAATKVTVNGSLVEGIQAGGYLELSRIWTPTDVVALQLDMRGRLIQHGDGVNNFVAIRRGPIVFARDSRFPGPPLTAVLRPVSDQEGYVALKPAAPSEGMDVWMAYEAAFIPESFAEQAADPTPVQLCDYASAGNGRQHSTFTVWHMQLFSGRNR
ncbi:glycoside hydrolase family 127 protein [Parapedobacter tibetensis]|uniref:glycoside hydrolase family 127 protein n=1 Tax=Parapedobacter tibetensis TaxID=2972951 RepID=UPI00214D8743|nr:glycoside hydrolase family 127 protein [Parapedobacter tibetensis]